MADNYPIPTHPKFKNLSGKEFGRLRAESYAGSAGGGASWNCVCLDCKRECVMGASGLIWGRTLHCPHCKSDRPDRKACSKCGIEKPFDAEHFRTNRRFPHGLGADCRKCWNADACVYENIHSAQLRIDVLQHYSRSLIPECFCCHATELAFLTIDHIGGGGRQHREQTGSSSIYGKLKAEGLPTEGYRVACMNCNGSLGLYGYCGHDGSKLREYLVKPPHGLKVRGIVPFVSAGQTVATCPECKLDLPLTDEFYYRHAANLCGFLGVCKTCRIKRQKPSGKFYRVMLKYEVLSHYSGGRARCNCCGIDILEFLSIDHVTGGGQQHRAQANGANIYQVLKRDGFPEGFQTLCLSCNFAKKDSERCPCLGFGNARRK